MALCIPHNVFHLARLLYVRPETFGPYYILFIYTCMMIFIRNFTRVAPVMHYLITVKHNNALFCHHQSEWRNFLLPLSIIMHYFISITYNDVLLHHRRAERQPCLTGIRQPSLFDEQLKLSSLNVLSLLMLLLQYKSVELFF